MIRIILAICDSSFREITWPSPTEVTFFYKSEGNLIDACTNAFQCPNWGQFEQQGK